MREGKGDGRREERQRDRRGRGNERERGRERERERRGDERLEGEKKSTDDPDSIYNTTAVCANNEFVNCC